MRYWCVNCGEPGICTRKTNVCGYCGWDAVSEWDEESWDAICKQRDRHPVPHPPRQPVSRKAEELKKKALARAKETPAPPLPDPEPIQVLGVMDSFEE